MVHWGSISELRCMIVLRFAPVFLAWVSQRAFSIYILFRAAGKHNSSHRSGYGTQLSYYNCHHVVAIYSIWFIRIIYCSNCAAEVLRCGWNKHEVGGIRVLGIFKQISWCYSIHDHVVNCYMHWLVFQFLKKIFHYLQLCYYHFHKQDLWRGSRWSTSIWANRRIFPETQLQLMFQEFLFCCFNK